MTQNRQGAVDPTSLIQAWIQAAADYWGEVASDCSADPREGQASGFMGIGFAGRVQEQVRSVAAVYQSLSRVFGQPDAAAGLMSGMNLSPQLGLKMANAWWKGFFTLQQLYLEKAAGLASKPETYKFEEIDKEAFKAWTDIYEQEIQVIFNIPPLGLARVYQERANQMMDRYNLFQAALSEFLYLTYLPVEKSLRVIREELSAPSDTEKPAEEFRALYRKWIGVLEDHYMTLLRSSEYIEALSKTIEAMAGFAGARRKWMEDWMKILVLPTQSDLDEVCRELHELKKEVRDLRKHAKDP